MIEEHSKQAVEGDVVCVATVVRQLKIHGLPHDADVLERELHQTPKEPQAVAQLRERTMGKFLHFFEV